MADTYYSVAVGRGLDPGAAAGGSAVVVGSSTAGGSVIELRVTDATTGLTGNKAALLAALEKIKAYIAESSAPA